MISCRKGEISLRTVHNLENQLEGYGKEWRWWRKWRGDAASEMPQWWVLEHEHLLGLNGI